MSGSVNNDPRVLEIIHHMERFASGDYGVALNPSDEADDLNAIMRKLKALGDSLQMREQAIKKRESRMSGLLHTLGRYTALDFSEHAEVQGDGSQIDALAAGLNTLANAVVYHINKFRDSDEQMKTIFQNAPDAVVVIDSSDVIMRWNPAASAMFGWKEEEVRGKLLHQILVPERFRERHMAGLHRFLKTGQGTILNKTIELPASRKENGEIDIELTISPGKVNDQYLFIAFLRDITERKKAAAQIRQLNATLEHRVVERTEELNASELKYRNLFQNNPMALWVLDIATMKFVDVNDSALTMYGYEREEFLSISPIELRTEDQRPRYMQLVRDPTGTQNTGIWKHLRKDGSVIHVEVVAHHINVNGRPARLILANNVTERKKMEQEILELNRDLEARIVQRTQALQEVNNELEAFTYSVSHDLRTPLRAIHGYTQVLTEDYEAKLDAEGIRLLDAVKSNARRMGQLVDDLLSFSRMGKVTLKETQTDVTRIVNGLVKELTVGKARPVEVVVVHPLGVVRADPALLQHVFRNLISNAIKFSSKKVRPKIEIGVTEIDGVRAWYVKDNGAGFDMAYYKKLFRVFERLHEQEEFEGTGVGLAMVRRIVLRHGGKIWATGRVGEGAEFYFTLGVN